MEFREKLDKATEAALGERLAEMYTFNNLVTRTEKRGRGYGTALVASVTAQVRMGPKPHGVCVAHGRRSTGRRRRARDVALLIQPGEHGFL